MLIKIYMLLFICIYPIDFPLLFDLISLLKAATIKYGLLSLNYTLPFFGFLARSQATHSVLKAALELELFKRRKLVERV